MQKINLTANPALAIFVPQKAKKPLTFQLPERRQDRNHLSMAGGVLDNGGESGVRLDHGQVKAKVKAKVFQGQIKL